MPIMKEIKLVRDVMVIETAASAYVCPIRSDTVMLVGVRRQAASNTNASSIPTPERKQKGWYILKGNNKCFDRHMTRTNSGFDRTAAIFWGW